MGNDAKFVLQTQRRLARSILFGIVAAVVAFVLFASGPNLAFSIAAQQTTTPPGGNASPGTYRVEFLNPSGDNGNENISDKSDGSDTAYHLVAWINQVPPDASVEFRYFDTNEDREVSIGQATQTGIPDTFHLFWDVPPSVPDDQETTLYAILYSGDTEVDRDTENDFYINSQDPVESTPPQDFSDPAYETVEITYPANGGAWGLFTPRDRATAGIINATWSEGTIAIRVAYTVSAPGTEPSWVTCGEEYVEDAGDGIRCSLSSQHKGHQVTGLAAFAASEEDPLFGFIEDTGDGHRVQAYEQVPGSVTLDQATQDNAAVGSCSRIFLATVRDQFSIPITNANLDVHARGPVDEIAFDSGASASPNKRPDIGHGSEAARDCSEDPPAAGGTQGDHQDPALDTKHIETAAARGTEDDGQWTFQLYSPAAGTTDFTVFADVDDDDAFCSSEASASGAVGWGQAAAPTTLPTDVTTCPSPSASSPDPGPSTFSPSPSDSESPDTRGCTITGTNGPEVLEGDDGRDVICGGGGNDVITGGGGNDVIYGDQGSDDIRGGGGADDIYSGAGDDTVRGNSGNDDVFGNADDDALRGSLGNDRVAGGAGLDGVRGGTGRDGLTGGAGIDDLLGGRDNDSLRGGPSADTLAGGSGRDICTGHGGRDTFRSCERKRQ